MTAKKNKFKLLFILVVVIIIGSVLSVRYFLIDNNFQSIEASNIAEFNTIDSAKVNNTLSFQNPEGNAEFSMTVKKIDQKQNTELLKAIETVKKAQDKLYIAISNGQSKKGLEKFSHAIVSTYKFPELYTQSLAFAYLTAGDCQQSAQLYQELVTAYPQNFSGFFGRAISYQTCGQTQKAVEAYQAALEAFPNGNGRYNYIVQQIKTLSNQVS